jgi:tRNA pseudouridine38-40 synthase
LEYEGVGYRGWSRQPGLPSIEGALLEAAAALQLGDVSMRVAGRTDSGVHASAQVVSFAYTGPIPPDRIGHALNSVLPSEIAVLSCEEASPEFDARASARSRSYEYRVLQRDARSPMRARRALHHPRPLDRQLLDAAAQLVVGQHDFTAFTPAETLHVFFHRTVYDSHWEERGDELVYCITANAFLRHMVRVIMGSMLAVGRGDWELERFAALFEGAPRSDAHHTAPPHALCLVSVEYGE